MVVAQIIDSLSAGGAEVVAVNLANALSRIEGVTSHLVVTRQSGPLEARVAPGVKLFVLQKKGAFDIKALFRLRQYFIKNEVKIVHAHSTSFLYPALLEPFSSFMMVWHDHYGLPVRPDGKRNYPYKLFSSLFDHVFCVSQQLLDNNRKHLRVPRHKIHLLYNFSVKLLVANDQKITRPSGKKVLVMSANLRPQKDHLNLIKAVAIVHQSIPNLLVYCIGGTDDTAYQHQLQQAIDAAGLTDVVLLMGSQPNPFAYYNIADVAVLSSASEGLPLTLIEYGLAAKPVVATEVGQVSAVVNTRNGWLVPAQDAVALANGIVEALTNTAKAQAYAVALEKHVQQFFSEEAAMATVMHVYKQLTKTGTIGFE